MSANSQMFIVTISAYVPWIMKTPAFILGGGCCYLYLLMLLTRSSTPQRKPVSTLWQRLLTVTYSIFSSWPGIKSTLCSFPWSSFGDGWLSLAMESGQRWDTQFPPLVIRPHGRSSSWLSPMWGDEKMKEACIAALLLGVQLSRPHLTPVWLRNLLFCEKPLRFWG